MQRKVLKTLPARTCSDLYRLSATVKYYGVRSSDTIVIEDIKRIIAASPAKEDFKGWPDKKLSRWFFDHFLRARGRLSTCNQRREELIRANVVKVQMEENLKLQQLHFYQQVAAVMIDRLEKQAVLSQSTQEVGMSNRPERDKLEGKELKPARPEASTTDSDANEPDSENGENKDPSSQS